MEKCSRIEQGAYIPKLIVMGTMCYFLPLVVRPVSADTVPGSGILKVANYSFAEKLLNPCAIADSSPRVFYSTEEDLQKTRLAVTKKLGFASGQLKEKAMTRYKTFQDTFPDCPNLDLPLMGSIPTANDLFNTNTTEALRLCYSSLLNHTTYVYFMKDQLQKYTRHGSCNSAKLLEDAGVLGAHMRDLLCTIGMYLTLVPEEKDEGANNYVYIANSTFQTLNETLMDQPVHSRALVRNCQIFRSAIQLLSELTTYFQGAELFGHDEL